MWSFTKLGAWVIFWSMAWFFVLPFRKGRHNCLTWAVDKWDREGGYLVVRWCRSNKNQLIRWPHFMWMDEKHYRNVEHLIPCKDEQKHLLPKPWFTGRHAKADPKENNEN
jgi:hypothetical protein